MVLESADPVHSRVHDCPLVTDPEVLEGYRRDASAYIGSPDGLIRPADAEEAAWWLGEATRQGVAVTPCGLRSSTTGSGLAARGWVMSCERINPPVEVDEDRRIAVVGAGAVLRDFKDELESKGLFYPPDPTSERECTLGGTVACDASGARSYRYGATHRWVRGVEVALLDGSVRWFRRRSVNKDAAGYAGLRDLVSIFCGSEGTLGFLTRVEVDLLDRPEEFLGALAFFTSVEAALSFVAMAREEDRRNEGVRPRCLELLDETCLSIMRDQDSGVVLPAGAQAAVFFEEEHLAGSEGEVVERWWSLLERSPGALADDTVVATDRARQDELRMLRHAVPATLNEEGSGYMAAGGKKISTDWAVPAEHLPAFMKRADSWLREAGIERVARFGHVGNGHPHYNLLLRDAEEVLRAEAVVSRMCREACALGGTITAEHGVGKVKRPYVKHRFGDLELASMYAIKKLLDPSMLLAPENLFP